MPDRLKESLELPFGWRCRPELGCPISSKPMFGAAKCSRDRHATAKVSSFWRQCLVEDSQVPLEVQQRYAAGDRRRR